MGSFRCGLTRIANSTAKSPSRRSGVTRNAVHRRRLSGLQRLATILRHWQSRRWHHHDRSLYQLTMTVDCRIPGSCWRFVRLDCNDSIAIQRQSYCARGVSYQLHTWCIWRYTGSPCIGDSCPPWQRLDGTKDSGNCRRGKQLYNCLTTARSGVSTGTPCAAITVRWQRLDNNAKTVSIAAGGSDLYHFT